MTVRFAIVAVVSLGLSACASRPQTRDELCAPLLDFARSVGPDEERSISFHTSWGRNFRDNPEPAIFAKRCVHGDYRPARSVCNYLIEHGATEFAGRNAQRAIACLAPESHLGPDVELEEGIFRIGFGTPNRGSRITVKFSRDEELGGMALRIDAEGH